MVELDVEVPSLLNSDELVEVLAHELLVAVLARLEPLVFLKFAQLVLLLLKLFLLLFETLVRVIKVLEALLVLGLLQPFEEFLGIYLLQCVAALLERVPIGADHVIILCILVNKGVLDLGLLYVV